MRLSMLERKWLVDTSISEHSWQKYRIRDKLIAINSFINALIRSERLHLYEEEIAMLFDTLLEAMLKLEKKISVSETSNVQSNQPKV